MDKTVYELAPEATTEITMQDLMQATVDEGASDLHIRVGGPPYLRCSGSLEPLDVPPLTQADVAKLALEISNEEQIAEVEKMLHESTFYMPVSSEERQAVVQAMATEMRGTGHWYHCENGHPFTIGECGMPMEVARCPECAAPVGGQNHTSVAGNRRAEDLENYLRR